MQAADAVTTHLHGAMKRSTRPDQRRGQPPPAATSPRVPTARGHLRRRPVEPDSSSYSTSTSSSGVYSETETSLSSAEAPVRASKAAPAASSAAFDGINSVNAKDLARLYKKTAMDQNALAKSAMAALQEEKKAREDDVDYAAAQAVRMLHTMKHQYDQRVDTLVTENTILKEQRARQRTAATAPVRHTPSTADVFRAVAASAPSNFDSVPPTIDMGSAPPPPRQAVAAVAAPAPTPATAVRWQQPQPPQQQQRPNPHPRPHPVAVRNDPSTTSTSLPSLPLPPAPVPDRGSYGGGGAAAAAAAPAQTAPLPARNEACAAAAVGGEDSDGGDDDVVEEADCLSLASPEAGDDGDAASDNDLPQTELQRYALDSVCFAKSSSGGGGGGAGKRQTASAASLGLASPPKRQCVAAPPGLPLAPPPPVVVAAPQRRTVAVFVQPPLQSHASSCTTCGDDVVRVPPAARNGGAPHAHAHVHAHTHTHAHAHVHAHALAQAPAPTWQPESHGGSSDTTSCPDPWPAAAASGSVSDATSCPDPWVPAAAGQLPQPASQLRHQERMTRLKQQRALEQAPQPQPQQQPQPQPQPQPQHEQMSHDSEGNEILFRLRRGSCNAYQEPACDAAVVRRYDVGAVISVCRVRGSWLRVAQGGWVDTHDPSGAQQWFGPPGAAAPPAAAPAQQASAAVARAGPPRAIDSSGSGFAPTTPAVTEAARSATASESGTSSRKRRAAPFKAFADEWKKMEAMMPQTNAAALRYALGR